MCVAPDCTRHAEADTQRTLALPTIFIFRFRHRSQGCCRKTGPLVVDAAQKDRDSPDARQHRRGPGKIQPAHYPPWSSPPAFLPVLVSSFSLALPRLILRMDKCSAQKCNDRRLHARAISHRINNACEPNGRYARLDALEFLRLVHLRERCCVFQSPSPRR